MSILVIGLVNFLSIFPSFFRFSRSLFRLRKNVSQGLYTGILLKIGCTFDCFHLLFSFLSLSLSLSLSLVFFFVLYECVFSLQCLFDVISFPLSLPLLCYCFCLFCFSLNLSGIRKKGQFLACMFQKERGKG